MQDGDFLEMEISTPRGMDETQPMRSRAVAAGECVSRLRFMGRRPGREEVLRSFYARRAPAAKREPIRAPFGSCRCGADATAFMLRRNLPNAERGAAAA